MRFGDCFSVTADVVAADALISDPPYGITACEWDHAPPLDDLRTLVERACKPEAVLCLFAAQPFTTDLIHAWRRWFRYDMVWCKRRVTGYLNANRMPLKQHESILVFGRVRKGATYHPQKRPGKPYVSTGARPCAVYRNRVRVTTVNTGDRHPTSLLEYDEGGHEKVHPTQKPAALMEHLVRSYTEPGELVFDPFAGSATTAIACLRSGRRFVGCESNRANFRAAVRRLTEEVRRGVPNGAIAQ